MPDTDFSLPPVQQPQYTPNTGLDYDMDIVPLKKQFFESISDNPNFTGSDINSLMQDFSSRVDTTFLKQQKLREDDTRMKQLSYDTALFSLNQAREKAVRDRSLLQNLAPLQEELSNVLNSDADREEKLRQYADIGVKNAALLSMSPAAANAFDATAKGLQKEPKQKITAGNLAGSGVNFDYIKEYNAANNISTDLSDPNTKVDPAAASYAINKTKDQKEQLAKSKEDERQRLSDVNQAVHAFTGIQFEKDDTLKVGEGDKQFKNPEAAEVAIQNILTYSPEDIQKRALEAKTLLDKMKIAKEGAIFLLKSKGNIQQQPTTSDKVHSLYSNKQ